MKRDYYFNELRMNVAGSKKRGPFYEALFSRFLLIFYNIPIAYRGQNR